MELINQNFLQHYQIIIKLTCYSKVDCCDIWSYKVDWLGPADYRLGQTLRSFRTFIIRCRQMPAFTEVGW